MKRREFLGRVAGATAGGLLTRSLFWPTVARALTGTTSSASRILVMCVFKGGNDGLNTLVPLGDPSYYALRPSIALAEEDTLFLTHGTGLHPSLRPIMPLWDAGQMAVMREVGYPNMSLSHFRGTDIMFSASGSESVLPTGWLGRWLAASTPDFPAQFPSYPLALQQGLTAPLPLQSAQGTTGVVVKNPSTFLNIVNQTYAGEFNDEVAPTLGGEELQFLREMDALSFEYANVIESASEQGANQATYPNSSIGDQLSTVARLIDGNLGTSVYMTGFGGFDTHAGQAAKHASLLRTFSEAAAAFFEDIRAMGREEEVILVTQSEFGRRARENGSLGTDHGTSSPWFALGNKVKGGLYGLRPRLDELDGTGNPPPGLDYRSVYSTLLLNWLGADEPTMQSVLMGNHRPVPFIKRSATGSPRPEPRFHLQSSDVSAGRATLRFSLPRASSVRVSAFDVQGRLVDVVFEGTLPAGENEQVWNAVSRPRGVYFMRVSWSGRQLSRKVVLH